MASITIDTTGLAAGSYAFSAGFSGPGDAILNRNDTDLSSEYTSIPGVHLTDTPRSPSPAPRACWDWASSLSQRAAAASRVLKHSVDTASER